MTAPDDLRPGMYVAVVESKVDFAPSPWSGRRLPVLFDGSPLQILAISLPFVSVLCRGRVGALDLRAVDVQKVTRRYAESMADCDDRPRGRRRRKEKPDPRRCANCGERYVQRYVKSEWHFVCPNCRRDAGVVT